jgi:hypothetical protein
LNGASDAAEHSAEHRAAVSAVAAGMADRDLAGEVARLAWERIEAGSPARAVLLGAAADYRRLAGCGIKAVMEIGIVRAGLPAPSMIEFTARPTVIARVRAVNTADGLQFLADEYRFRGRSRNFRATVDDAGRLAREEIAQGLHEIADQIAGAGTAPSGAPGRGLRRAVARVEGAGHDGK